MFTTVKYNNEKSHDLDQFDNLDDAIKSATSLHDPSWPCWQGIKIYEFAESTGKSVCVYDTNY